MVWVFNRDFPKLFLFVQQEEIAAYLESMGYQPKPGEAADMVWEMDGTRTGKKTNGKNSNERNGKKCVHVDKGNIYQ